MELIFYNGECHLLYDGELCDRTSRCDPYIRISLNDEVEYESHWVLDTNTPNFNIIYVSPIIYNTTKLGIELIDSDSGHNDELMERWSYKTVTRIVGIKRLDGNHWPERRGSLNKIFVEAYWTRMPDYDPML